jgi:GNAT superfamily N-acetyltransferase
MIAQTLTPTDLPAVALLQPAGWGDILPAHHMYLAADTCFPIKVVDDDQICGIGTVIINNDAAWLAHIIVNPEQRNKGVGTFITRSLMDTALDKSCSTLSLIATDLGAPVYEKLGFINDGEYLFFKDLISRDPRVVNASEDAGVITGTRDAGVVSETRDEGMIPGNILRYEERFKKDLLKLDHELSAEDRASFLEQHLLTGYVYLNGDSIEGFYLPAAGEGLVLARSPQAGVELMKLRLSNVNHAVFPVNNTIARNFYEQHGNSHLRRAKRMVFGRKRNWHPDCLYNRIGGNFG